MSQVDFDTREIQLAIVLKLQELQRSYYRNLRYENIEDMLKYYIWRKGIPTTLHIAVNDILSITADRVVQYLSSQATKDGFYQKLTDFEDVIGGKRNE